MSAKSVQEQRVQTQDNGSQRNESQVLDIASSWQRVLLVLAGMLVSILVVVWSVHAMQTTDPYVRSVLVLTGDAERGRDIFQLNCSVCHGLEAAGEVGPDLHNVSERKSRAALIEQVISGKTPPMPQFQPNEKDMADLLSFLETL